MDKELIFVVVVFWLTSSAYVLYYFNKHHKVIFETVCFAILLGPIIALIMKDPEEEKYHYNYREDFPDFNHTPPPPISRIERARTERDEAIRSAIERVEPPNRKYNNKDFKFFRG
jgi:hypothetical protein